jgi:predicted nuclease with TOPRIM domain
MADKREKWILELEAGMRQLMRLCDSLKDENRDLRTKLEEKEAEITRANAEIGQLNAEITNLVSAGALVGVDAENVEKTKKRLSKLVQDVEKCISLLKA